jgi:Spy/CpxP family protein refolding chaperone
MSKAKIILVFAFLVVCAAGVVVGTAVDRHVRPVEEHRGGLPHELGLTSDQEQQMKAIWDGVIQKRVKNFQLRDDEARQRDSKIRSLLTDQQKSQYDDIVKQYESETSALKDQLHQAERDADQKTRALLTPEQAKKWDDMRKRMPHEPRDHDHFPRDHHRPPPSTQPGLPPPPGQPV